MSSLRKFAVLSAFCIVALGSCVVLGGNQRRTESDNPLGFPTTQKSPAEVGGVLSGSFILIKRVEELPETVRKVYLTGNGVGSGMANPDEKYNPTDVVDRKLPGRRLVVGGQRENLIFVHYEKGGYARSMVLDILQIDSTGKLQGIWEGFCYDYKKPARSLEAIRALVSSEGCEDKNAVGKPRKKKP